MTRLPAVDTSTKPTVPLWQIIIFGMEPKYLPRENSLSREHSVYYNP